MDEEELEEIAGIMKEEGRDDIADELFALCPDEEE
jgi:hypothetical protein